MAFNTSRKLADNITAIGIALNYTGQVLSADEINALSRYSGFGGIKAILYPPGTLAEWQQYDISKEDLKLHGPIMELHEMLREKLSEKEYKRAYDSIFNSVSTAFFT